MLTSVDKCRQLLTSADGGGRHRFLGLSVRLPLICVVFFVSYDYVLDSWARGEASREAGGLPALFLLKTVILAFCVLIGLQGLSLGARSLLVLMGHPEFQPEEEAESL